MPTKVDRDLLRCALRQTITALRASANITQERLAQESGIDRGYMGQMERGVNMPSIEMLYRIFPPLGTTFVDFAEQFEVALRRCRRAAHRQSAPPASQ